MIAPAGRIVSLLCSKVAENAASARKNKKTEMDVSDIFSFRSGRGKGSPRREERGGGLVSSESPRRGGVPGV